MNSKKSFKNPLKNIFHNSLKIFPFLKDRLDKSCGFCRMKTILIFELTSKE
jgi:hypothetical protein